MKNKIGKAAICICLLLWLCTLTSKAHCNELATIHGIKGSELSRNHGKAHQQQGYLASFHSINRLLLDREVLKHSRYNEVAVTPEISSLLGDNSKSPYRALAHHVYVKTDADVEKLLLQFPLKPNYKSTHGFWIEGLLDQIMEQYTESISTDLLSLNLIKDSAAYRVNNEENNIGGLIFEFDLTQQGLVQKGKIVSLFFHYLQEYFYNKAHSTKIQQNLAAVTNSIFSIESMRLWHFSNDQLTRKILANAKVSYAIKPFNSHDLKLFKQKYPRSLNQYFLSHHQSNLIFNNKGLNIWLSLKNDNQPNKSPYKIYLRGNKYHHNLKNYVTLNLMLAVLNTNVQNDTLTSKLSSFLPFAVELSNEKNQDLLSTLDLLNNFTLDNTIFKKAKLSYLKRINQTTNLRDIALIELDKATLSTVNLWSRDAILETLGAIEIEHLTAFRETFFKSISIDIVLGNDHALTLLPLYITNLEQMFTLDEPNVHLNHYNQYYTPAVGTLLNKRLYIEGDKNFLLDVYVSPTKTHKQELSTKIITTTLQTLFNKEAPWLRASFRQVNGYPSIYFHIDGNLNNMGEVKENINKLLLSIKPKVKSHILNNFKKLRGSRYSSKYSIRPSDVMRVYNDIFLDHQIENILIQLNGKQNQTAFFVALSGKLVR